MTASRAAHVQERLVHARERRRRRCPRRWPRSARRPAPLVVGRRAGRRARSRIASSSHAGIGVSSNSARARSVALGERVGVLDVDVGEQIVQPRPQPGLLAERGVRRAPRRRTPEGPGARRRSAHRGWLPCRPRTRHRSTRKVRERARIACTPVGRPVVVVMLPLLLTPLRCAAQATPADAPAHPPPSVRGLRTCPQGRRPGGRRRAGSVVLRARDAAEHGCAGARRRRRSPDGSGRDRAAARREASDDNDD